MSVTRIPAPLRRLVSERARHRCEYCLAPSVLSFHPHAVDHIIAEKHGGLTDAGNLALACIFCNQFKGSDIASIDPETGRLEALYHPRKDRWSDHFQLNGALISPCTPTGRVTARLLQLNAPERVEERLWFAAAGELTLE